MKAKKITFRVQSGQIGHRKVWAKGFDEIVMAREEALALLATEPSLREFDIANETNGEIVDTLWR